MNEIILVRHGETDGQSSIRLNGITDVNLSDLGREQMRRAAATLTDVRFDRSYVSTLRRSRQSYEIVAEAATCTAPIEEAAFREVNFGDWEAMTWAEVEALDPERYARARSREVDFTYPNGDSRIGFYERVRDAALLHLDAPSGRVLATLHKGVTKIIVASLCRFTWEQYRGLPCELASIHRLVHDGDAWRYVAANQIDHLGDAWLEDHPPGSSGAA